MRIALFVLLTLQVGSSKRYLVDDSGQPVFLNGEAAWSLISGTTREQAEQYLDDRRRRGFNAIIVNLIEHKFNGPRNRYGDDPFLSPSAFDQPNEKYFAHADWVLAQARARGFTVLLFPLYLGYIGLDEGWYDETLQAGAEKCARYGAWVRRRYAGYSNVIWVLGGDRNPEKASPMVDALARAIRAAAPKQLMAAHDGPQVSGAENYAAGGWLDINSTYTYAIVHKKLMPTSRAHHFAPT